MHKTAFLLACLAAFGIISCSGKGIGAGGSGGSTNSVNTNVPCDGCTSNPANQSNGIANGVVSGKIVDKGGNPVSGVSVTAYHTNNNTGVTVSTDASGAYSFTNLSTGNFTDYQIYVSKNGFGFYPSVGSGAAGILKADYNGYYRTVIHYSSISTTPLTGANFTAFHPGDKVVGIPRTGQTTSYAVGDDGSANKGVAWPSNRFTDNKDGTVTDGLTGLIWTKNAGCFAAGNWASALASANKLASGQCGLTDGSAAGLWRMPNANELESLVDVSQSNPSLTAGNPFSNVASSYWSSTSYQASLGASAMVIRFTDGRWINGGTDPAFNNDKVSSTNSLWAVRSGSPGAVNLLTTGEFVVYSAGDDAYHTCPFCVGTVGGSSSSPLGGDSASLQNSAPPPFLRFTDNGDGTLSDTATGLTWLKKGDCLNGSWSGALSAVNSLASGQCGLTDGSAAGQWRMPNRFEMLSIAERTATFPIANYYDGIPGADGISVTMPTVFTNFMVSQYYWTSSTYSPDGTQAWTVYSCDFGAYNKGKSAVGYTMAVR